MSYEKDAWREGGTFTANGKPFAIKGRCRCNRPMYSQMEIEANMCVDCQVAQQRRR